MFRGIHYKIIISFSLILFFNRLLNFISNEMSTSPHLEFYLLWSLHIFNYHGRYIKEHSNNFMGILRNLQKNITKQHQDLSNM